MKKLAEDPVLPLDLSAIKVVVSHVDHGKAEEQICSDIGQDRQNHCWPQKGAEYKPASDTLR
jgi:hypothetical protein